MILCTESTVYLEAYREEWETKLPNDTAELIAKGRFERHRDKQKETFFTRVCLHTREQLEHFAGRLDYVIYGGAPETIMISENNVTSSGSLIKRHLTVYLT